MAKTLTDLTGPPQKGPDPYVAISRRGFAFEVEGGIFGAKENATIITDLGATFLCAEATCFALLDFPIGQSPPESAPGPARIVEMRITKPEILKREPYMDRNRRRIVGPVEEAMLKALASKGWSERAPDERAEAPTIDAARFRIGMGDVEPDVMVMRVSELFGGGPHANLAQMVLQRVIRFGKRQDMIGALHDFAVLAGASGMMIAGECRKRARVCGWGPA